VKSEAKAHFASGFNIWIHPFCFLAYPKRGNCVI
jgi:hypothetical protein